MQSLGAMRVMMWYIAPKQQLYMQQINKWFYSIGSARIQTTITLKKTLIPQKRYRAINEALRKTIKAMKIKSLEERLGQLSSKPI